MDGWPAEPVFTVGDARYDWADVLRAGPSPRSWAELETQIRQVSPVSGRSTTMRSAMRPLVPANDVLNDHRRRVPSTAG